jgi:hypothetical protein
MPASERPLLLDLRNAHKAKQKGLRELGTSSYRSGRFGQPEIREPWSSLDYDERIQRNVMRKIGPSVREYIQHPAVKKSYPHSRLDAAILATKASVSAGKASTLGSLLARLRGIASIIR